MTDDQLLDEQRKLITDRAETFAVEFIAEVSSDAALRALHMSYFRAPFATHVQRSLKQWLPLGGRIQSLPISTVKGSHTAHCIAYLEVRHEVDAHELASAVCRRISSSDAGRTDYARVLFIPVVQRAALRAGRNPGLWNVTDVIDSPRTYSHVVVRGGGDLEEGTGEATSPLSEEWSAAQGALDTVAREFAEFEFSPMDVAFKRRLLWDLTEPATVRFYEEFDAANMLRTDELPDAEVAREFILAAGRAVTAWKAADRNARTKAEQNIVAGGEVLNPAALKNLNTATSAMALALDESTPAPEAGLAWKRSTEALSRANLAVPPSWMKKMEATEVVSRALKALPSGSGE